MCPPARSSTSKVNPPNAPSPLMEGGAKGITSAPWMPNKAPRKRGSTACSLCSSLRRSSNGFSDAKINPWLGALPVKLKPMTENTDCTSGVPISTRSASRATFEVASSDDPAGAWMIVRNHP